MASIITVSGLKKSYASGFQALKGINLEIEEGEIFALLGPNGAGKTTMISIICGNVRPSGGTVTVAGHDIVRDYRGSRSAIGESGTMLQFATSPSRRRPDVPRRRKPTSR